MITIVSDKKEVEKYIKSTGKLFELYRTATKFQTVENFSNSKFKLVMKNIEKNEDYNPDTLKGKILRENMIGDKSLTDIANECVYSVAHIYNLKQKILREFAAVVFEVIII